MTNPSVSSSHKRNAHKWFGPNTHWAIAGSVVVILLGGYYVYTVNRDIPTPMTLAPLAADVK